MNLLAAHPVETVKRVLLIVLGLAVGMLAALLALVFVLAYRSPSEIYWPVVRVFAGPGWIALGSFAILAIWFAWEMGVHAFWIPSSPSHSLRLLPVWTRAFGLAFLVTTTAGGAALALIPGHPGDDVSGIKLVPVLPPSAAAPPLVSYVVFFPNGSPQIPTRDRVPLAHFLHHLAGCHGLTIRVTPFVSSAAYAFDDEKRNGELLQHRVDAVTHVANLEGLHEVESHNWQSLGEMRSRRGFVDQVNAQRLLKREAFNRRVEIVVSSYGECGEPVESVSSAGPHNVLAVQPK